MLGTIIAWITRQEISVGPGIIIVVRSLIAPPLVFGLDSDPEF
jgi:hypothetical protein